MKIYSQGDQAIIIDIEQEIKTYLSSLILYLQSLV